MDIFPHLPSGLSWSIWHCGLLISSRKSLVVHCPLLVLFSPPGRGLYVSFMLPSQSTWFFPMCHSQSITLHICFLIDFSWPRGFNRRHFLICVLAQSCPLSFRYYIQIVAARALLRACTDTCIPKSPEQSLTFFPPKIFSCLSSHQRTHSQKPEDYPGVLSPSTANQTPHPGNFIYQINFKSTTHFSTSGSTALVQAVFSVDHSKNLLTALSF